MTLDADVLRVRCSEIEVVLARLRQIRAGGRSAYWEVDYNRVFDVLENDLDDLDAFSRAIAALL